MTANIQHGGSSVKYRQTKLLQLFISATLHMTDGIVETLLRWHMTKLHFKKRHVAHSLGSSPMWVAESLFKVRCKEGCKDCGAADEKQDSYRQLGAPADIDIASSADAGATRQLDPLSRSVGAAYYLSGNSGNSPGCPLVITR